METKIKVTGAIILSEELRAFVEKKIGKLAIFLENDPAAIAEVEVGTTSAGQRTGDVYRAEVHLTFTGGDAYAEAVRENLHAALDQATGEARRELRKKRGKNRDLVRRGAAQVKDFFRNFGK